MFHFLVYVLFFLKNVIFCDFRYYYFYLLLILCARIVNKR